MYLSVTYAESLNDVRQLDITESRWERPGKIAGPPKFVFTCRRNDYRFGRLTFLHSRIYIQTRDVKSSPKYLNGNTF